MPPSVQRHSFSSRQHHSRNHSRQHSRQHSRRPSANHAQPSLRLQALNSHHQTPVLKPLDTHAINNGNGNGTSSGNGSGYASPVHSPPHSSLMFASPLQPLKPLELTAPSQPTAYQSSYHGVNRLIPLAELAMEPSLLNTLPNRNPFRYLAAAGVIVALYIATLIYSAVDLPAPSYTGDNVDYFIATGWILFVVALIILIASMVALFMLRHPYYPAFLLSYMISLLLFLACTVLHTSRLDATVSALITNPHIDGHILSCQLMWIADILYYVYLLAVIRNASETTLIMPPREELEKYDILLSIRSMIRTKQKMLDEIATQERMRQARMALDMPITRQMSGSLDDGGSEHSSPHQPTNGHAHGGSSGGWSSLPANSFGSTAPMSNANGGKFTRSNSPANGNIVGAGAIVFRNGISTPSGKHSGGNTPRTISGGSNTPNLQQQLHQHQLQQQQTQQLQQQQQQQQMQQQSLPHPNGPGHHSTVSFSQPAPGVIVYSTPMPAPIVHPNYKNATPPPQVSVQVHTAPAAPGQTQQQPMIQFHQHHHQHSQPSTFTVSRPSDGLYVVPIAPVAVKPVSPLIGPSTIVPAPRNDPSPIPPPPSEPDTNVGVATIVKPLVQVAPIIYPSPPVLNRPQTLSISTLPSYAATSQQAVHTPAPLFTRPTSLSTISSSNGRSQTGTYSQPATPRGPMPNYQPPPTPKQMKDLNYIPPPPPSDSGDAIVAPVVQQEQQQQTPVMRPTITIPMYAPATGDLSSFPSRPAGYTPINLTPKSTSMQGRQQASVSVSSPVRQNILTPQHHQTSVATTPVHIGTNFYNTSSGTGTAPATPVMMGTNLYNSNAMTPNGKARSATVSATMTPAMMKQMSMMQQQPPQQLYIGGASSPPSKYATLTSAAPISMTPMPNLQMLQMLQNDVIPPPPPPPPADDPPPAPAAVTFVPPPPAVAPQAQATFVSKTNKPQYATLSGPIAGIPPPPATTTAPAAPVASAAPAAFVSKTNKPQYATMAAPIVTGPVLTAEDRRMLPPPPLPAGVSGPTSRVTSPSISARTVNVNGTASPVTTRSPSESVWSNSHLK